MLPGAGRVGRGRVLLEGSKEKQLLEGLLIGKEGYVRESGQVVARRDEPGIVQGKLFDQ